MKVIRRSDLHGLSLSFSHARNSHIETFLTNACSLIVLSMTAPRGVPAPLMKIFFVSFSILCHSLSLCLFICFSFSWQNTTITGLLVSPALPMQVISDVSVVRFIRHATIGGHLSLQCILVLVRMFDSACLQVVSPRSLS